MLRYIIRYIVLYNEVTVVKIQELLLEHNLTAKDIADHQQIPYTTLQSAFSRPLSTWSVAVLEAVAKEMGVGVESVINLLGISDPLSPFIKWVGGKRQLLHEINLLKPAEFNGYYEPFIGGGAVFLNFAPQRAVINDFNPELVNTWQVVQNNPQELLELLQLHEENNSKEYYLNLRSADRDGRLEKMTDVERAARFIYMNKTGFNGLWRVNQKGQNNVPYGRYKNPKICDERILLAAEYLQNNDVTILNGDYREAIVTAKQGDLVYFDPPYIPVNLTSSFTSYTQNEFGLTQQTQLRDTFVDLTKKGVQVMLSNSDVPLIEELYGGIDGVTIHHVTARRAINSVGSKRGKVGEVIITNY
ncbi:DNA methyltransferase [Lactobacillus sp. PFC-70]|nr:DNA methyltransferase [Lactobacillus sp. PFC-70]